MLTAYVGFTAVANPKWLSFLPEPSAPSNYKDEAKIKEYIEKAKAGLVEKAATMPLCGSLKEVSMITGSDVASPGDLDRLNGYTFIIGFRIFDYLDLALIDVIDRIGELPERFRWAKVGKMVKTGYLPDDNGRLHQKVIIDPASALVGDYDDKDLPGIMKRFGINCGVLDTAVARAQAAKTLARKLGL